MKLVTKALEKLFAKYPIYSQDGKKYDAVVIAKFFMPGSGFTWYVTEATKLDNGDYEFFGYVDGLEGEFGYFTLSHCNPCAVVGACVLNAICTLIVARPHLQKC